MRINIEPIHKIMILALILRVIWALFIPVIPISDSLAYDTFAKNIWLHGTYGWSPNEPYSYWPVGTSGIYALFFSLFGQNYWPIVGYQCLISVGIIYLTHNLIRLFFESKQVANLCAFLLAVWPTMVFYVTILGSELHYLIFSLIGFYCFFISFNVPKKNAVGLVCLAGVSFAAAYYVRPMITVPILICLVSAAALLKHRVAAVVVRAILILLILCVAVAPWAYRNYKLHDAFVPMSSNAGAVFWMGNQPGSDGGYMVTPSEYDGFDTQKRSEILKADAIRYIKDEPLSFVSRTFYKLFRFHSYESIGVVWNEKGISGVLGEGAHKPLKIITNLYWLILVCFALAGVVSHFLSTKWIAFLFNPFLLFWASSAAIHSLIVSQDRYHLTVVPFIFTYSAYAIVFVYQKLLSRNKKNFVGNN